jgi:hypothetical protein
LWFTETTGNRIGRITVTGQITEIGLPANTQPVEIIAAADGNLWFTSATAPTQINRFTPAGAITNHVVTGTVNGLTPGPEGNVWFTQDGQQRVGFLQGVPDPNEAFVQDLYRTQLRRAAGVSEIDFWITRLLDRGQETVRREISGSFEALSLLTRGMFRTALGRAPAPVEYGFWVDRLVNAGRSAVVSGIEGSFEARSRVVNDAYLRFLGRTPVGGEDQTFVNALLGGSTDESVLATLLGSNEYLARSPALIGQAGAPPNERTFVQALYTQLLRRPASPIEENMQAAQVLAVGRTQVALNILSSVEHRRLVVIDYYRTILGRALSPSPQEVDGWVNSGLDFFRIRLGMKNSDEFVRIA